VEGCQPCRNPSQLTIDNLVDIDDWDDLYLSVDYEVGPS
jgi:hypothetical protein